ncbi:hypothetical protein SELMODRAFT_404398 [Selaginella moellendorffii]|uniref:Bulb-type lectin domain-containing protein n=1 Tax=Selaginella moellendorffii TaxID=88036 RepID=D8QV73_SELML|nr:hypothetical protein SELMODRAFT_404398 [Selaginella moellendorffii]
MKTVGVLAVLLVSLASVASGRVYTIPENWTATIQGRELPGFGSSGSYILVSAPRDLNGSSGEQEFLLSDNGTFGLAFLNFNGTGNYYLSLVMGATNATAGAPIWTANRSKAVSNESRLTKTAGQLKLLNGDLTTAWSPSDDQTIASIGLDETGNMVLYNSSGGAVWESFDHPTDVLLPGQRLVTGQRFASNLNSSTMSEGVFTATMEARAIVLAFSPPSQEQQPYFLWSLGLPSTIDSARVRCPGYVAVLQYTTGGAVNMAYERSSAATTSSPCNAPLNVSLGSGNSKRQLRLESDGNLISYKLHETGNWETEFLLTQFFGHRACDLPLSCGSYGLCNQTGPCECMDNRATNITTVAESGTCESPNWASRLATCDTSTRAPIEFRLRSRIASKRAGRIVPALLSFTMVP